MNKKFAAAAVVAAALMLSSCKGSEEENLPANVIISDETAVTDMSDEVEENYVFEEVTEPAASNEIDTEITSGTSETISEETAEETTAEERSDPPSERYSSEDDEVEHQATYYEEHYNEEEEDSDVVNAITLTFYKKTLEVGDMVMPIVTMYPEDADDKSEIWTSSDYDVAEVDEIGYIYANGPGKCVITVTSAANPNVYATVNITVQGYDDYGNYFGDDMPAVTEAEETEEKEQITEPTYINGILVANKTYGLPADYDPGFSPEAQAAFDEMQEDAAAKGLNLYIASGFRSYEYQTTLYNRYVERSGKEEADRYSARPGYSEHQTGLAIDLNTIDASFADTDEYEWVKRNCYKYGFIIRYPEGAEEITGYMYEPWHLRYLGRDTARDVYESGLTLEEYLGIDSKYDE